MSTISLTEYVIGGGGGFAPQPTTSGGVFASDPDTSTVSGDLPASQPQTQAKTTSADDGMDMSGVAPAVGKIGDFGLGLAGIDTYGAGSAVGGLVDGKPVKDTAVDAGLSLGARLAKEALGSLGRVVGPTVGLVKESFKENPNYGAALLGGALPSLGSLLGATFGPLGAFGLGTAADMATRASLKDGLLGDMTDARSYEGIRDRTENRGWGYGETADMAERQSQRIGSIANPDGLSVSPTLGDVDKRNPFGPSSIDSMGDPEKSGIDKAAENALGNPKDLADFAKSYDPGFGGDTGGDGASGGGTNSKGEKAGIGGHGDTDKSNGGGAGYGGGDKGGGGDHDGGGRGGDSGN